MEEEKKISLSIRIKALNIENLGVEKLRVKAQELWECIVKLETEKYDLEERQKRQDYDVSISQISTQLRNATKGIRAPNSFIVHSKMVYQLY